MRQYSLFVIMAAVVAAAGCGRARKVAGTPPGSVEVPLGDPTGGQGGPTAVIAVADCTRCHGTPGLDSTNADPLVAAAPPNALRFGGSLGAGAHRAHLQDGPYRRAVECASCHLLPKDATHPSQKMGKVSFSRLATTSWSSTPSAPTWNGTTCAGTYCHGNFRNGRTNATPSWTAAGSIACGSCHAISGTNGPGGTHPTLTAGQGCDSCHGPGYANGNVDLNLHMNGRIDGSGHPPGWKEPDQHGRAALAAAEQGGAFADACTGCHIGFGSPPGYTGGSCDACHATPSAYGPYATGTYPNHASWQTECTFCHGGRGGDTTGAPPRNTHVVSTDTTTPQPTTDPTIGAHRSHVNALHGIALAFDCTACHRTRWTSATDVGHIDKPVADVFFNPVGATSNLGTYARPSCSSTYCHGSFAGGAGNGPVSWTGTFGATFTLGCTSCHGAPPGPTSATVHHPPNPTCASCHSGYTASAVAVSTHVDGTVQHAPATGCTQCHGDLGVSAVANTDVRAAPAGDASAVDAHGDTATQTSARGVGAHAKHLTGTTWRATAISCGECHSVPTTGDVSHANGNPAVAFGTLARTAWTGQPAITPVWNGAGGATTLTCSSTYCHGAFKNGANAAPTWASPSAVTCGSCHGVSATNGPGGSHPVFSTSKNCGSCHGGTYTNTSVDSSLHMNGALNVANLTCSTCHGDSTRTPVATATALDSLSANLVLASPPVDAGGGAAATGAHLAHVNQGDTTAPGALSNALACSGCHAVPTSTTHSNGVVGVTFSGLATTGGVTPAAYDFTNHRCASTYCHGNFTGGAGANAILWTATGKLACSSCHGAPPGPTSATVHHPPNPTCASCHSGYTATTVAVSTHVDGTVQHAPATGCTQCHGDLGASAVANTDVRAAPAGDANAVDAHGNAATATASRGVGAHAKHLTGTTWSASSIPCTECHAVPAAGDVTHANGNPAVAFGALAKTAWSGQPAITPVWNGAGGATTLTCSSTYCHGNFPNGASAAPTWATPSPVTCGSCHGVSQTAGPGGTHPTFTTALDCGSCHGGTYTDTTVDPQLHLNGKLDGGAESAGGIACGGCHSTVFAAMNGTATHASKHSLGNVAGTNDSPTDSGITWANPLSTNTPAARSCVNMCHGDHPHDLTSPATATHENNAYLEASTSATRANGSASRIGVGGTGGTPNRTKTDFDGTQTNGGMCISCHRNPIVTAGPSVAEISFDASAHDYSANTVGANTWSWSYLLHDGGLFVRDCTKCHASRTEGTTPAASGTGASAVHFSDDATLLAGTTNPAGTAAGFVCYNCHGSTAAPAAGAQGDRSGKNIQGQIAHATTTGQSGHPANSDTVHDSSAEYAGASFGNALGAPAGTGQRHSNCLDCHDPHQARAGTHAQGTNVAGPPLQGAWGARLSTNPAFWTAPGSGNFLKTAITAGTEAEATLCFKCHSSYYGTLPAAPSWSPSTWPETDTAREFNPNNAGNWATAGTANQWNTGESAGSFHPVLAAASGNLGVTSNIKAPWTTTSLMTCSDCHESDSVTDPNGPHGSAAKFILKGPNTAWDATVVTASTGMPNGTFCINCHNQDFTGSRFFPNNTLGDGHVKGNHLVACFNCHAAVPHGSPRPGLLVTVGRGANVPGAYSGFDGTAPYFQMTSTANGLYLNAYPSTPAAYWQQGNCGCGPTNSH